MCAERPRLGVLGGTFDPVHLGHLASAREVAAAFELERVLMVVSARPPHKGGAGAAPARDRLEMLRLAIGNDTLLEPCDIELRREGPSYTVDTLREIAAANPDGDLFLIVGIDAWREIDTWRHPEALAEFASVIVTSRPGCDEAPAAPLPPVAARELARYDPRIGLHVHNSGHAYHGHRLRGFDASATDIRRRVRDGLPFEHLTGPAVARYIREHGLYREPL
jgi:nicotinate-nucleotide adenylyltransferase